MTAAFVYALAGVGIFCLGFHGLIVHAHIMRKALALNFMGTGIFLVIVALADRSTAKGPDPVPDAIVLTSIVVAVSTTALLLALFGRFNRSTGATELSPESEAEGDGP